MPIHVGSQHAEVINNVAGDQVVARAGVEEPTTDRAGLRVLYLAANPTDTDRLMLDREIRTIDERLRLAIGPNPVELQAGWATRPSDLSDALLRWRPHIVHFSGHGTPDGIVLEDQTGRSVLLAPAVIAELFGILTNEIQCVVFNACFARGQAHAVADQVGAAVGTSAAITDAGAIAFAAGFYRGIGYGESLQTSFDLGKNEVQLMGHRDGALFHLIAPAGASQPIGAQA